MRVSRNKGSSGIREMQGSEMCGSAAHACDTEDGETGAEPQGYRLDGAVSDKLFVCPLWVVLAGPS